MRGGLHFLGLHWGGGPRSRLAGPIPPLCPPDMSRLEPCAYISCDLFPSGGARRCRTAAQRAKNSTSASPTSVERGGVAVGHTASGAISGSATGQIAGRGEKDPGGRPHPLGRTRPAQSILIGFLEAVDRPQRGQARVRSGARSTGRAKPDRWMIRRAPLGFVRQSKASKRHWLYGIWPD